MVKDSHAEKYNRPNDKQEDSDEEMGRAYDDDDDFYNDDDDSSLENSKIDDDLNRIEYQKTLKLPAPVKEMSQPPILSSTFNSNIITNTSLGLNDTSQKENTYPSSTDPLRYVIPSKEETMKAKKYGSTLKSNYQPSALQSKNNTRKKRKDENTGNPIRSKRHNPCYLKLSTSDEANEKGTIGSSLLACFNSWNMINCGLRNRYVYNNIVIVR